MASFGESLRQERLRRQISLEQVAEATKIVSRFLRAIEDERLQELPGGVFNRNFIRNYARYLGLDEDYYVEEYIRATGDAARTSDLPVVEPGAREPIVSGTTLLAVMIGGVVGLVIWAGIHLYQEQQQARQMEATAVQPAAVSTSKPASPPAGRQLIAPPRVNPSITPPKAAQPTAPATQAGTTPSSPALAGVPPVNPAFTPAPAGEQALIVSATVQPAWVSVYTDGQWQMETTLKAGEQKEVFFRHTVRVTSGNAGATAVSIDGKSLGTLGKIGMVAHFNWPQASTVAARAADHANAAGGKSGANPQPGNPKAPDGTQN